MDTDVAANAQVVMVRTDSRGKVYGHIVGPEEKVTGPSMHRVIMVVME